MMKAVNEVRLEWFPPKEPSRSRLDEWFLPGRHQALSKRSSPFFPEVHDKLLKSWRAPYSSRFHPSASAALTSVDGTEEKGNEHLPPLDESVAAHLCPPTAIGWKASHPSKPCRAPSALAGRAYSAAGQLASALHSMAVLQVFQAKILANEEAGLDTASLKILRSTTDLALRATKATAQAVGRAMSSLIVLECHLWLTMTEMKEADKVPFFDAQVLSGSLFGPAVEGFAECFTEAQKSSQAMQHFLPKCTSSSSASSRPIPAAKPTPTTPWARPPEGWLDRGHSGSVQCYPFLKRQGPRPKIALDSAPCLSPPRLTLGAEETVFLVPHGPTIAQRCLTAVISDKIKHIHFQKESKNIFLPTISVLPLSSQSAQPFQPLATRGEAWQAIPGKTRLYSSIHSKTTTLPRVCSPAKCTVRSSAQRWWICW